MRQAGRTAFTLIALLGACAPRALADPWDDPSGFRPAPPVVPQSVSIAPHRLVLAAPPADEPPSPPTALPPIDVYGTPVLQEPGTASDAWGGGRSPTGRAEDTLLGPNRQPEWTTNRSWTRVRAYVLAPGQVEVESWYRGRYARHGGGDRHVFQEEIGIGLPGRFQFDFYLNFQDDDESDLQFEETQVEVRWALADWDRLPLNPTLYLEYRLHDDEDASDAIEAKLLLSDDLAYRWRWGANLLYERETSGGEEEVLGFAAAVSYSLIDQRLAVGAEFQAERATVAGGRDDPEYTYFLGPSVQIRLGPRTHLDVAPLFGLNDESERMQLLIVLGIDIGPSGPNGGWLNPTSTRSR